MRTLWSAVALSILLLSVAGLAGAAEKKLVTTDWLAENLDRPDLRIIDIRDNIKDYWAGHLPGAVHLNQQALRLSERGVPGKLAPPVQIALMLGRMGINEDTMVVVYSEASDFKGPYFVWAMEYIGHEKAAVVDGGFKKWTAENRPVTQDYPRIPEASHPMNVQTGVRATLQEVIDHLSYDTATLLDVRPTELYTGEEGPWKRRGHIAGAISHPWTNDLTEQGTWKDADALRQAYADLGITADETIITSCGQGQMSAHTWFTLKHVLGFPDLSNYDGSFNEWSNLSILPVVTGSQPE